MRTLVFLIAVVFTTFSYAGDKGNLMGPKGTLYFAPNGYSHGGVVVCRERNQAIKNVYLLDYMDLDTVKTSLIEYNSRMSDYDFLMGLADILEKEAPYVFQGFKLTARRFAQQTENWMANRQLQDLGVTFASNYVYVEMNESKVVKPPKGLEGCRFEQAVIGQKSYNGIFFTVQADLFSRLSRRDRRGLMIHEALFYSLQRYYGDVDSARTRYVHQRLMQYSLESLTSAVVADILSHAYLDFAH